MDKIARLFVQNPAVIFLIAGAFFAAYFLLRNSKNVSHPKVLLWPATAFAAWAIWEFMIMRFSPESNIRVDLLLIIPVVLIATAYGIIRLFMAR
jgi:hypothetical protein